MGRCTAKAACEGKSDDARQGCIGCRAAADADFGVDEWHGTNVFYRDGERIFRTYFLNNRGDEQMGGTWNYLDITPLGRQEIWEDSPKGYPQTPTYKWWNWHDSYVPGAAPDKKWAEVSDAGEAAFRKAGDCGCE